MARKRRKKTPRGRPPRRRHRKKPAADKVPRAGVALTGKNIFTVTGVDLARLGTHDAVEVFGELLWAESRRAGIPTTQVSVPRWIDVPDGGIDAKIDVEEQALRSDLLKAGYTGFQIKANSAFHPWKKTHIHDELFGKKRMTSR